MDAFHQALLLTLGAEGGEANVSGDRGGHTYLGVTQRRYDAFRDASREPRQDVLCITEAELETLYRLGYWNQAHCDDIAETKPRLACLQFDSAVNHGPANAVRLLQEALGFAFDEVDGAWGQLTAAALSVADENLTISAYFAARQRFYDQIVAGDATQEQFAKGWANRLDALGKALSSCAPSP